MRELPENTPIVSDFVSVAYDFIKRHPELKTSKPKIVDVDRLAVSCQQVLKPWVPDSSNRNVVHPANAKPGVAIFAARMVNSTLIAEMAADGQ
ncbi:uncharacterized protein MONOS_16085 [Monocercomonoides exilis]|uniref:uncharacterized protein n=1 Tax=Monocercomonoides exilis TaxID=2049356 RepID=UPI00355939F6|nr:hypothetical protein MONOS_16085 [Monocercomonoides exilis]|eukprot:MONOS_16085.1-p1 / transcript=MONOS_16085.1 / gene=MONOS_16085 / organism=Monocercomonoides_exilis_PA203 / gene_product=unspecified product / transcript_product=unspecified product / location=Mono_scaffold01497:6737-7169(-) / protein_length=93 / sequence_SO=supercontig / SO=protein_coding / is_pseudo=false